MKIQNIKMIISNNNNINNLGMMNVNMNNMNPNMNNNMFPNMNNINNDNIINVVFEALGGRRNNIIVHFGTSVEEMLKKYFLFFIIKKFRFSNFC